jgi:hypothetical protein
MGSREVTIFTHYRELGAALAGIRAETSWSSMSTADASIG